jgi:hypothetical protein
MRSAFLCLSLPQEAEIRKHRRVRAKKEKKKKKMRKREGRKKRADKEGSGKFQLCLPERALRT